MSIWQKFRLPFLATILGGTVCTLSLGMTTPTPTTAKLASFTFPETVPLKRWQQVNISAIKEKLASVESLANKTYQYRRNSLSLNIEMHYMQVNKGDVNHLIGRYTSIPPSSDVHQQEGIGAYALIADQQKLYLSSCINPQGRSTATNRQYFENKLLSEVRPGRIGAWLLGQGSLFDQRCLWTIFSIPIEKSSNEENSHRVLKEAWGSWYTWWQSRFPQP